MLLPKNVIEAMIQSLATKFNLKAEIITEVTMVEASYGPTLPPGTYVYGMVRLSSPDTPGNPNGPRVVTANEFFDGPFNNAEARIRTYAILMGAYKPPSE